MALKSTTDRYGVMAVSIHWVSAVLILILIGSGFRAATKSVPLDQVPQLLGARLIIHLIRIAPATVGSVLGIFAISR